jgi:hypothetical protein
VKLTPFRIGSPPAGSNAEAVPVVPPRGRPAVFFALVLKLGEVVPFPPRCSTKEEATAHHKGTEATGEGKKGMSLHLGKAHAALVVFISLRSLCLCGELLLFLRTMPMIA